jgi:hypothetical protein
VSEIRELAVLESRPIVPLALAGRSLAQKRHFLRNEAGEYDDENIHPKA